jgi:hypothetical protein
MPCVKFGEKFVKNNAIKRTSEINVNVIDIATAGKGNNPITGRFQQVSGCRILD